MSDPEKNEHEIDVTVANDSTDEPTNTDADADADSELSDEARADIAESREQAAAGETTSLEDVMTEMDADAETESADDEPTAFEPLTVEEKNQLVCCPGCGAVQPSHEMALSLDETDAVDVDEYDEDVHLSTRRFYLCTVECASTFLRRKIAEEHA